MKLYARLIRLWPHHERKQIEDFLTECFAESLRYDYLFVRRVLSCIAPDREWPEITQDNYSVQTQEWYSDRRFDMHLRLERDVNIVFEHKVDAPLGIHATEEADDPIDQIDEYCGIIPDNWHIAYIGNTPIVKRDQPKFIGGTTWNQIAKQLQLNKRNILNDGLLTLFEELNMTDLNFEDLYSANRGYRFKQKIRKMLENAGTNIDYRDYSGFNWETRSKYDNVWVGYYNPGINHPFYCWQCVCIDSQEIKKYFDQFHWDDSIPVLAAGIAHANKAPIVSLMKTEEYQSILDEIKNSFQTVFGNGSSFRLDIEPPGNDMIVVSTSLLDIFSLWENQDEYLQNFIQQWVDFLDQSGILRFITQYSGRKND